jgi:hypothetical protein
MNGLRNGRLERRLGIGWVGATGRSPLRAGKCVPLERQHLEVNP